MLGIFEEFNIFYSNCCVIHFGKCISTGLLELKRMTLTIVSTDILLCHSEWLFRCLCTQLWSANGLVSIYSIYCKERWGISGEWRENLGRNGEGYEVSSQLNFNHEKNKLFGKIPKGTGTLNVPESQWQCYRFTKHWDEHADIVITWKWCASGIF